jgi:hypothetical protein
MIEITYSTRSKTCHARWYPRPDRISIFLNKISLQTDPDKDLEGFIAHLCSLEFHELLHIYGDRSGCYPSSRCQEGLCYSCRLTVAMYLWFKYENTWIKETSHYLKTGEIK